MEKDVMYARLYISRGEVLLSDVTVRSKLVEARIEPAVKNILLEPLRVRRCKVDRRTEI